MDAAYDPEQWHDLAVAVAGASAALAGLLVIAVSINLQQILGQPSLPRRVAASLTTLTTPLLISVLLLVPSAADEVVGAVLVAIGVAVGAMLLGFDPPANRNPGRTLPEWALGSALPSGVLALATATAGIGLLVGGLGGLYWVPVAVAAAFVGGIMQSWILLIEILR